MRQRLASLMFLCLTACRDAPVPSVPVVSAPPVPSLEETPKTCRFAVARQGHVLTWTAFKFTERLGVEGSFDTMTVVPGKGGDAAWKAVDGVTFQIDTASVSSGNPGRDEKIREHFFGSLTQTASLTGRLKANSPGKATLTLTMNGATESVVVDVSAADGVVHLRGILDVESWGGGPAIAALNQACEGVHKGEDGVSKLWSEVELAVAVSVEKTCG